MSTDRLRRELLEIVPDHPVWIEARAALLDPGCRLFGDPGGYVIRADTQRLAAIGGEASEAVIREALSDIGSLEESGEWAVVAPEGFREPALAAMASWRAVDADIFREPADGVSVPSDDSCTEVRAMEPQALDRFDELSASLYAELTEALGRTEMVAAWIDGRPVSFCYVACQTDTLWDISINTAPKYRRLGLAGATVARMARRMRDRGKRAVWGAHTPNVASRSLALKLGFEPVGRLCLFENGAPETVR